MSRPILAVIAAVASDGGIGRGGALLWQESEDQKHFRRVTMGCPVVMGRKTWDSLPERFRPLPGRRNIVVTRQAGWQASGAEPMSSLDDALRRCRAATRVFVIGGGELYAQAVPRADELVLTEIDATFAADTFFPAWDRAAWRLVDSESRRTAAGIAYRFNRYERNRSA